MEFCALAKGTVRMKIIPMVANTVMHFIGASFGFCWRVAVRLRLARTTLGLQGQPRGGRTISATARSCRKRVDYTTRAPVGQIDDIGRTLFAEGREPASSA